MYEICSCCGKPKKPKGFNAAISSPPYASLINNTGEGPGARHDYLHHKPDTAERQSSDSGYGATPGNLGNLSGDGFQAAVSSPPYSGDALGHDAGCVRLDATEDARRDTEGAFRRPGYGVTSGNIGNDTGDTFWAASRLIVAQTYAALRPGGYAAWVTKRFVRKGQIVPFSDQWEALCAAVGFVPVERIHALLVDDHGTQLGMFGEDKVRLKERKSFFRRLAEKKGSPRIDHEDVLILRKPQ